MTFWCISPVHLHAGAEAWQVWIWSHSDVLGAGPAEAAPWQDAQPCCHWPREILQVGKDNKTFILTNSLVYKVDENDELCIFTNMLKHLRTQSSVDRATSHHSGEVSRSLIERLVKAEERSGFLVWLCTTVWSIALDDMFRNYKKWHSDSV